MPPPHIPQGRVLVSLWTRGPSPHTARDHLKGTGCGMTRWGSWAAVLMTPLSPLAMEEVVPWRVYGMCPSHAVT